MFPISRAVVGASLSLLSLPASAEDDPQERVPIVVVGAAPKTDVAKTPGGADLVTASDYADTLAVSLRDALAFSPGVYTQPRFGQEVRISIRGSGISRGFHMRGLMLLQDGVPINLADNNGDFQEFDPAVFESIAVYRGGNALRFGGSTLGGAINATTPTGRSARGYDLRLDGGSFDTLRGKVAAGFAEARGDAYLALTADTSDGDRAHARRRGLRFNGNVGLRLADSIENRTYASIADLDQRLPGALTRAVALSDPAAAQASAVSGDQQRNITSIRLQNRTTVDVGAGTVAVGIFLNDKQLYHPIFQVIDQASTDYGAFVRAELSRGPVSVALGSTARFGHVAARQFVNVAGRRGARTAEAWQQAHTIDSYGELRAEVLPTLSLIAGAVHTHGERRVTNRLAPARSGAASFDTLSPKLGVLLTPRADLQFYANYSRSIELPGFSELNQTPFAVGGVVTPGFVAIDPQRAWTAEIGTRGTIGPAMWDVTLYRADIRGELLQFDQGVGVPAATFNARSTRHQGIEASLDLTLAPWLRLRQAYQLNDFAFRGDRQFGDNRLPVVARHLYRGEVRVGTDGFSVAPTIEWVPQGAWADYANSVRAPGYVLFGGGARAKISESVSVFVDARNLTGRRAIGDISAVTRATAGSAIYYPVERRAIYAGVRARY
ncbi:TonB-dependent receptor family protein [Sphingomonas sp. RS2018]